MATNSLLSIPPEIVVRILKNCDLLSQLSSFIAASKSIHSIWLAHKETIVWHVGKTSIPAFEYALLAVRAANLVTEAIRASKDPPSPFPIDELWGKPPAAPLFELRAVLDLQHLLRCIEHLTLKSTYWGFKDYYHDHQNEMSSKKSPSELRVWRDRFYRAMYRVIFAGAVFYRTYNQPFAPNTARPPSVPRTVFRKYDHTQDEEPEDWDWPYIIPLEGAQYLQKFPVYNASATEEEEKIAFGAFADWLVQDGRRLAKCNHFPDISMPHRGRNAVVWGTRGETEYGHVIDMWQYSESSNVSAVWEVMSMLKAYHLLFRVGKFINGNGAYGHGRWNPDDSNPPARQLISGPTREVTMISFGVFGIETISMPADADGKYDHLIANPAAMLQESANAILGEDGTATNVDISTIQDEIFRKSGFPNHNDNHPMAPLSFKLFEFTLRAHFNLQFHITTFDNDINYAKDREELWDAFCDTAATFHRADSTVTRYGFEILEPYRPRILSYSQLE